MLLQHALVFEAVLNAGRDGERHNGTAAGSAQPARHGRHSGTSTTMQLDPPLVYRLCKHDHFDSLQLS